MNGSADARAVSKLRLSPVDAEPNNVNVSPSSPERARVLNVPKNDLLLVPHVPSLQTAICASPAAAVCTLSDAKPMPCVGSEPLELRLAAIKIGTMSPGLPPRTWKEYVR